MIRLQTLSLVLAAGLTLLAVVLGWYAMRSPGLRETSTQAALASLGGPFELVDQDGKTRTDREFRGRFMLVYFGYTWCPDICPTTLASMSSALLKLGAKSDRIVPIFVTVDPQRDTPAAMKKYVAAFGRQFVGLTGKPDAIAHVAREYRVYFAKQALEGSSYAVTHSSTIYLVGPNGKLVTIYDSEIAVDMLAKDLRSRL